MKILAPFFPVLFVVFWLLLNSGIARVGGWHGLGKTYRAKQLVKGSTYRAVSGCMSDTLPVRYGACMSVTVVPDGFYVLMWIPLFRFRHPPLYVPWSALESVSEEYRYFIYNVDIKFKDQNNEMWIKGKAGQAIYTSYLAQHPELATT